MVNTEMAQIAHLMRRAGFGATREELEMYVAKGYEATVEELLHPENAAQYEDDIIRRHHTDMGPINDPYNSQTYWVYRMINTKRPLEEKIALFWHGVLATAYTKLNQMKGMQNQINMFRKFGLGSFHTLLLKLSKDGAMMIWLDNVDSHKDAPNENYGRELLELFSMGVGMDGRPNYTEDDVKACARAFTGWTIRDASHHSIRAANNSTWPYGKLDWQFQYRAEDHDDSEKTFLGHTGRFNGEDIIDIICQQPATARFISRHLYNFFVADEVQVPAWQNVPPRDIAAVESLADTFVKNESDIRTVLRVLFNSDYFKNAAFAKVKSPTELVVGTMRLTGGHDFPSWGDVQRATQMENMGQKLMDPPSVEGWYTGNEWLTTGSLVTRINFAVEEFANTDKPGIRNIIDSISSRRTNLSPEGLVDTCLDLMGPLTVSETTRQEMVGFAAEAGGDVRFGSEDEASLAVKRIRQMLQLIVSTREYQLC